MLILQVFNAKGVQFREACCGLKGYRNHRLGREGRGPKGGDVIIQTRMPGSHAIQHAITHNVTGFVHEELGARRMPAYPPFVSIANVMISGLDQAATATMALSAAQWVQRLIHRPILGFR